MTNSGTKGRKTEAIEGATDNVKPFQRWNAQRICDVVLRLLRGESLDAVSRDVGLEIPKLEKWREQALEGMQSGLRARGDGGSSDRGLEEALHRLGELSMENELLRRRCGLARPTPARRSKP